MSKLSLIAMTVLAAALFAGSCARKPGLTFVDAPAASPTSIASTETDEPKND